MSWGTELWDQYDNLSSYTNKAIDFLDVFSNFVRQRCIIEIEYASKIRRLTKNFIPKKSKDDDYYQFSYTKAFLTLLNETNDVAGQHEVIAENLTTNIANNLSDLIKNLKEQRKRCLLDGNKLNIKLLDQEDTLSKSKKNYEKNYKESIKAQIGYEKADADLNLSRADVEKHRANSQNKTKCNEEAKLHYGNRLLEYNEMKRSHYNHHLPAVLQRLQEVESDRIKNYSDFVKAYVHVCKNVLPIVNTCYDNIEKGANEIDHALDNRLVIEKYKSGFEIPEDEQFVDLSENAMMTDHPLTNPQFIAHSNHNNKVAISDQKNANHFYVNNSSSQICNSSLQNVNILNTNNSSNHTSSNSNFSSSTNNHNETKPGTNYTVSFKNTLSKKSLIKKRNVLFNIFGSQKDDFSDLPPNQRRKKLLAKIDAINSQLAQEKAARDAMLRMREVYEKNPSMGNPLSIDGQLNESSHRLTKLNNELNRYQTYLRDIESSINLTHAKSPCQNQQNNQKSSNNQDKINHSSSFSINSQNNENSENSYRLNDGSLSSEDCSLKRDEYDMIENCQYYPSLGHCIALYDFDGSSEGSIPMKIGQTFEVVELDQGDGWTRVRMNYNNNEDNLPVNNNSEKCNSKDSKSSASNSNKSSSLNEDENYCINRDSHLANGVKVKCSMTSTENPSQLNNGTIDNLSTRDEINPLLLEGFVPTSYVKITMYLEIAK
ncbi:unnamed protein product [Gordionus sp. m RMFG-2023]|uniref:cdc42-interacting protein 4 homolog n=1 Tax=Gordionus sp. m RMFG-2023 TaxID=3053472 RepID=UPI0030DF8F65